MPNLRGLQLLKEIIGIKTMLNECLYLEKCHGYVELE
jgi:hypothetical protein